MTHDLRWTSHVNNITTSASRSLGFLRRNLQIGNPKLKSTAYQTLVRPTLEYAPTVWDPYTKVLTDKIEMVQRRAARFTLNRYRNRSSVTEMLEELGWQSLQERRKQARLCMLYKIKHDMVAIDAKQYITPMNRPTRHTNSQAYVVLSKSTVDYHQQSFFPRTVREWNSLPESTVSAPSLPSFRSHLGPNQM